MKNARKHWALMSSMGIACCMLLVPSVCFGHTDPAFGGTCECDEAQFSLQVINAFPAYGSLTVSPEKDFYIPGEMVTVNFTPAENCGFASWSCEPNSLYASGSPVPTALVKMTDDTILMAIPRGPGYVDVSWNPQHGDVGVSGNLETITDTANFKKVRATGELFSEVSISTTPNTGRGVFMDSLWVQAYGGSATVPILSGAQGVGVVFPLLAEMPTLVGPFTASLTGSEDGGGGDIRMGDNHSGGSPWGAPAFLTESTMASVEAEMNVWLEDGIYFDHWTFTGSTGNNTSTTLTYPVSGPAREFTAVVRSAVMLNLVIEGGGYVTSDDFTFFYDPEAARSVGMFAEPCSGNVFHHWEQKCDGEEWEEVGITGFPYHSVVMSEEVEVKAVFAQGLVLLEPNGDPITDNHFAFDSNDPGACAITPTATGSGACGYDWSIDSISGSTLTFQPDPPNSGTPTITYTNLPTSNDEFGDKTLTVSSLAGSAQPMSATIQVFFDKQAQNHPVLTPQQQEDMLPPGVQGNVPNWFYYWLQTSAGFGSVKYGNSSTLDWDSEDEEWYAQVGSDAADSYAFPGNSYPVLDYDGSTMLGWIYWSVDGIDTFVICARHEACHVSDYQEWWPTGYIATEDNDGDRIADNCESELNYSPNFPDSNGDGHNDSQDLCLRKQFSMGSEFYWTAGSANSEDWACPGKQSNQ